MKSLRNNMFLRLNTSIDDVFPLMSKDEQIELEELSLKSRISARRRGVYRGMLSFERLNQFEQKMIDKYYTEVNK